MVKYDRHVSKIGILKFTSPGAQRYADGNAFAGQAFKREGTGHLLNRHYLDTVFKMNENGKVDESGNDFMNSLITNQQKRCVVPIYIRSMLTP